MVHVSIKGMANEGKVSIYIDFESKSIFMFLRHFFIPKCLG